MSFISEECNENVGMEEPLSGTISTSNTSVTTIDELSNMPTEETNNPINFRGKTISIVFKLKDPVPVDLVEITTNVNVTIKFKFVTEIEGGDSSKLIDVSS